MASAAARGFSVSSLITFAIASRDRLGAKDNTADLLLDNGKHMLAARRWTLEDTQDVVT